MRSLLFLLVTFFYIQGWTQKGIPIVSVKEAYTLSELKFTGELSQKLTLPSGLIITITPINPPDLNSYFYNLAISDGKLINYNYEETRSDYFISKKKVVTSKTDDQLFNEVNDWLLEKQLINDTAHQNIDGIINGSNQISSIEYGVSTSVLTTLNPFFIKGTYFNVFEVKIENPSSKPIHFNNNIAFQNKNKLYNPLNKNDLIELYNIAGINNLDKIKILNQVNLPSDILIPSTSTVVKYAATEPIYFEDNTLQVSINSDDFSIKGKWTLEFNRKKGETKYSYYAFSIEPTAQNISVVGNYSGFFAGINKQSDYYIVGNNLYVNIDDINLPIEFVSIFVTNDNAYYSIQKSIIPSDYINEDKTRLQDISFEMTLIQGINRKSIK